MERHSSSKAAAHQSRPARTASEDRHAPVDYGPLPALTGYHIRVAYSRLVQTFAEMLGDLDIAPTQYSALMLIALNPGLSQVRLAEAIGHEQSTIVPVVNRFVRLGWVRRMRRKNDRRTYSLRLTPVGQEILDTAQPLIERHDARLVACLNPVERQMITEILARIADRLSPARHDDRSSTLGTVRRDQEQEACATAVAGVDPKVAAGRTREIARNG